MFVYCPGPREAGSDGEHRSSRTLVPAERGSFNVYRGPDPGSVLMLARELPVASEFIDDGSRSLSPASPPDPNYDHANFYWRLELEPEAPVTVHSANTIGCDDLSMTANEFRGAVVRITSGTGAGQERAVSANTDKVLTVAPGWVIEPDGTSKFTVAEGSWKFGALTVDGPAKFDVPNFTGGDRSDFRPCSKRPR